LEQQFGTFIRDVLNDYIGLKKYHTDEKNYIGCTLELAQQMERELKKTQI